MEDPLDLPVDPSWTRWVDLELGDVAVMEEDGELVEAVLVAWRNDSNELVFLRMAWYAGLHVELFTEAVLDAEHKVYRTVEGSGWVLQRR